MKYLASVSYDGSKFYGFQKLNNYKTVQEEIEKALTIINKTYTGVKGAGRTDRGVHAYSQGVTFDLNVDVPIDHLLMALNRVVDNGIHFNYIEEVLVWAFFSVDKANDVIRGSIRSRGPIINEVASSFGGGGHIYASGVRIKDISDVDALVTALDNVCKEYKDMHD